MPLRFRISILFLLVILSGSAYGLFDTGTAMDQGKLELDLAINPFRNVAYGQSWVFWHYGLGSAYEFHGYLSKHGSIDNWTNSNGECYLGILKQWFASEQWDFATSVGWRSVPAVNLNSLIGPGILYTYRLTDKVRVAGHLQYIGNIAENLSISKYNLGYTSEVGLYYLLTKNFELAGGIFTNSIGEPRPIYTLNYYF